MMASWLVGHLQTSSSHTADFSGAKVEGWALPQ